jgi:hypothetical protein
MKGSGGLPELVRAWCAGAEIVASAIEGVHRRGGISRQDGMSQRLRESKLREVLEVFSGISAHRERVVKLVVQ